MTPWVVSSAGDGDMRLLVASEPPWPKRVHRAAKLVEVLDDRHRADRADAQEIADDLQTEINRLGRDRIEAWLSS